jgi:transposase
VVDQNYTVREAAKAMNVGVSTMAKWVTQLKQEREEKPYAAAITNDARPTQDP